MTTTYELKTLRDVYENVPADKLALCMREIAEGMEQAKALEALMNASAATLTPGASVATIWPDVCAWIDDGKEDKSIGVTDGATGEVAFTLETRKSESSGQIGEGYEVLTVSAGSPRPPEWVRDDCA